jgi:sugar phosphate isomerase/epimerase
MMAATATTRCEDFLIRTGVVSVSFRSLQPREIINLAARARLDAIEWGGDIHVPPRDLVRASEVRDATQEAGLSISSYGSYYRLAERRSSFEPVLETAMILGAPTVRVWAGALGSAQASPEYFAAAADELADISHQAAKAGVAIALELHAGTLTDSIESTCRLIDRTNCPTTTCYWQPPHGQSLTEREAGIRRLGRRISNIHVFHWIQDSAGEQSREPLFSGASDWRCLLNTLSQLGGDRFALLEFVLNDDPDQFLADARTLKGLLQFQPSTED